MASEREFDLIVYGATGFTGRLVGEYLVTRACGMDSPRWAMAGRGRTKLEEVRSSVGVRGGDVPLIVADAADFPPVASRHG